MWQSVRFRAADELCALASEAKLRVEHVSGAIYYPRSLLIARFMAPADSRLGERTAFGAAFLAVQATKI